MIINAGGLGGEYKAKVGLGANIKWWSACLKRIKNTENYLKVNKKQRTTRCLINKNDELQSDENIK